MDVMRYLIDNVWYWRARLVVDEFKIDGSDVTYTINNLGHASTMNATLQYIDGDNILWQSNNFTVNATESVKATTGGFGYEGGEWRLSYQKRVVSSSRWVNETVNSTPIITTSVDDGFFLDGSGVFDPSTVIMSILCLSILGRKREREALLTEERI